MSSPDVEFLRNTPAFWSRLGFHYDPPRYGKDGKVIRLFRSFEELETLHREMYAAGIGLHSSILFSGWTGVNQFDYDLTDRTLESIFSCGKDLLYIPRIKLNVPIDWCAAHPEEVCVYADGPREIDGIRALVGTPLHDILGYNSAAGYSVPGNVFTDDRPNVNGLIALQSFSSAQWLTDAGESLERLLEHIRRDTPFADRIPAYHFAYGPCGETSAWGQWSFLPVPGSDYKPRCGDYGIAHTRNFFRWCVDRYGSLENLRTNWNMPMLTEENFQVPDPDLREGHSGDYPSLFRLGRGHCCAIDYELFMEDCQIQAMNHFGSLIHRLTGKCAGAFAGYFVDAPRTTYSGNGATSVLARCQNVDFFAAPKSYFRNGVGEAGGEQGTAQAINLRRVWMDEIDNGTHLDFARSGCRTWEESRYLMWREVAKDLAHNSGFWWMDLGNGWYHDARILSEIRSINTAARQVMMRPHRSVSQILLVADDAVLTEMKVNAALHRRLLTDSIREASLLGTPVDLFRLDDLDELDCSGYKFVIFLNAFCLRPQHCEVIRRKLHHTLKLWQYAAGILEGSDLIPFRIEVKESHGREYPVFSFQETADMEILSRDPDGMSLVGQRGRDIYSSAPAVEFVLLRHLAERAGCSFMTPPGNVIYADNRFCAVFRGREAAAFDLRIPFHGERRRECISGQYIAGDTLRHWGGSNVDCVFLLPEETEEK